MRLDHLLSKEKLVDLANCLHRVCFADELFEALAALWAAFFVWGGLIGAKSGF